MGPFGKGSRHRHLVIGGTKAHVTPIVTARALHPKAGDWFAASVRHPGAKPNPWMPAGSALAAGMEAAERVIAEALPA